MDEEFWGYLILTIFFGTIILLFVGAWKAQKGKTFWAVRLLMAGASLMLLGALMIGVVALWDAVSDVHWEAGEAIAIVFYCTFLLGSLLYAIGFLGFSARWGATGKRRTELLEITAALSAARDQAQREFEAQPPHSNPQNS